MIRTLVRWLNAGPSHPAVGGRLGIAVYEYGDQHMVEIDIVRRYSSGGDSKPDKVIHTLRVDREVFAHTAAMLAAGETAGYLARRQPSDREARQQQRAVRRATIEHFQAAVRREGEEEVND